MSTGTYDLKENKETFYYVYAIGQLMIEKKKKTA